MPTTRTQTQARARAAAGRRAAQEAARNAVRAARAARRGTFENVITMANVPTRYGVTLNKQTYDPRALAKWLNVNPRNPVVPTSRRRLNAEEVAMVRRMAAIANGAEGYAPLHTMFSNNSSRRPAQPAAPTSTPRNRMNNMRAILAAFPRRSVLGQRARQNTGNARPQRRRANRAGLVRRA